MSSDDVANTTSTDTAELSTIDMALEVVQLPVSDVDRAKRFYQSLGWRFDIDLVLGEDFRTVQFTPVALAVLDPVRQGPYDGRAGIGSRTDPRGGGHRCRP